MECLIKETLEIGSSLEKEESLEIEHICYWTTISR